MVKLVDVYPEDFPDAGANAQPGPAQGPPPANAVKMGGYEQLVRGEPFRGKFRNSFEKREAFIPDKPAKIEFDMPDVRHTSRQGHRAMVPVQSSWFPLVDRNPQKFVEIPRANAFRFSEGDAARVSGEGDGVFRIAAGFPVGE